MIWRIILGYFSMVAVFMFAGLVVQNWNEEPQPEVPVIQPEKTVSRPERCAEFLYERTEDEWDEERHEYWPPNHEWEECMGIGRR